MARRAPKMRRWSLICRPTAGSKTCGGTVVLPPTPSYTPGNSRLMNETTVPSGGMTAKEKLGKTLSQLWQITKAFFRSERRGKARVLLILLLTLSVAYVGVIVLTSYAGRDLINAIEKKNTHAYWVAMGRYLGTFVVAVLINRSFEMFTSLLGTWIPFALIFLSTYLTGLAVTHKSQVQDRNE